MTTKQGKITHFFPPLFVVVGSGMEKLGSGIKIPDPQN